MAFKVVAPYYISGVPYPEDLLAPLGAEFVKTMCRSEDEIIEACKDADAITAPSAYQPLPAKVIENLPRCRHIASVGVGFERIDVKAASARDIVVTNTPLYCLEEVSDHAMALLLALARKLPRLQKEVKQGTWSNQARMRREVLPPLNRLRGRTLGIIGFGNIARTLVPKARGFGLQVIAYSPEVPREIMSAHFGVRRVELDQLLRTSDFISLHAALTNESRKMIGREEFQKMKPSAIFINTARGELVDEAALIEALEQGRLAGAGLDVLETEPPNPENPLLSMDNLIISGHTAQYSDQSEEELWRVPIEELTLTLQGRFPRFPVNPEIRQRWLKKWRDGKKEKL